MMKRVYYETSLSYLTPSAVGIIFIYGTGGISDSILDDLLLVSNVILLIWCIIDTFKNRRDLDEIIENGHCVNAAVTRLKKVSYEYHWGKGGGMDMKCYQIEAKYLDHTYISAPVLKRYRRTIPREVKIYSYMGRDCFVWDLGRKEKIPFDIADGKDLEGAPNRTFVAMFTTLWLSAVLVTLICVLLYRIGIL